MALAKGMHNQLGRANRSENRAFLLLLMPFMGLFFIFTILPIVSSIVLSFTDYDMINTPRFTGLSNYLRMFTTDEVFPVAVKNTLLFSVITGPVSFFLAFLLAWLINEFRPGMRSLLAFLFYAPALIGNVYYIWQVAVRSGSYGYAHSPLLSWGRITEAGLWVRDVRFSMIIVMIVQLWLSIGISFLADIAGLQNVNPELYEAGAIDGIRTRWHELWYITLPSMKSILLFGAVMQIQATFSISAVPMALAGFPSVNNSVDTLVTHLMDVGTQRYELGYAAAVSVFLFMLMALFRILVGKALDLMGK